MQKETKHNYLNVVNRIGKDMPKRFISNKFMRLWWGFGRKKSIAEKIDEGDGETEWERSESLDSSNSSSRSSSRGISGSIVLVVVVVVVVVAAAAAVVVVVVVVVEVVFVAAAEATVAAAAVVW
ncbi:hypothetical protein ElyMa_001996000 [Elysia marginata]|uniref:Uncharacterized protein n=1 Tax=Elysia marginata TaxID=1093978 RepID=A0AAV4F1Z6_9GAST|nr:hypothetical protein ElyMa_001996000 [Elysia marginata]